MSWSTGNRLALTLACSSIAIWGIPAIASATHARPKGASPSYLSLVPAYEACGTPNRTHGPSLAFPSCNPPVQSSDWITVGSPDANGAAANSVGSVSLEVKVGVVGPPDTSDVLIDIEITDVRCKEGTTACGDANATDGADYTGEMLMGNSIHFTDHWNAVAPGGGPDAATVIDVPHTPVLAYFSCAATADPAIGGTCSAHTSSNTTIPGSVRTGKREVAEIGQNFIEDGGADGLTGSGPDTLFARQGIFVP